jgi:uncharacterized protein YlzI (FlbEa/FlbD family)
MMVKLTDRDGDAIFVNPDAVTAIEQGVELTRIRFGGDAEGLEVREKAEEVAEVIKNAKVPAQSLYFHDRIGPGGSVRT